MNVVVTGHKDNVYGTEVVLSYGKQAEQAHQNRFEHLGAKITSCRQPFHWFYEDGRNEELQARITLTDNVHRLQPSVDRIDAPQFHTRYISWR